MMRCSATRITTWKKSFKIPRSFSWLKKKKTMKSLSNCLQNSAQPPSCRNFSMRRLSSYRAHIRQVSKMLLVKDGQSRPETSCSNLTNHSLWWGNHRGVLKARMGKSLREGRMVWDQEEECREKRLLLWREREWGMPTGHC